MRRDEEHQPVSVKELALSLPQSAFETIAWREGACEPLSSRFARVRVRPAHRDYNLDRAKAGGMASDRMAGGRGGANEILALNPPARRSTLHRLWITRSCAGASSAIISISNRKSASGIMKAGAGAAFHHHATLCIAAYAFLISERETIPPSGSRPAGQREKAEIPEGYKPRGHAAQAGEAYTELHRNAQTQDRRRPGESPAAMSLLRQRETKSNLSIKLMTQ